jgi:hypothetical protein
MDGTERMNVVETITEQTVEEGRSKGEKGTQGLGTGKALRHTLGRREGRNSITGAGAH